MDIGLVEYGVTAPAEDSLGGTSMRTGTRILAAVLLALVCLAIPDDDDPYLLRAGRERTIAEAVRDLSARSYRTRQRALRRLISLGEAARPALALARVAESAEVRTRAAVALCTLDERARPAAERRERDFAGVIRIGLRPGRDLRPGTNRFVALTLDPGAAARAGSLVAAEVEADPARHRLAVALLIDLGHEDAAPYLADLLARGYPLASTLHLAARGLARFAGPEVLPDVRSAAGPESEPVIRRYAIEVLAVKGEASDLPLLLAAAADRDPAVRAAAAGAAGLLGGRRAIGDLERLLGDEDAGVRVAALEALARIPSAPLRTSALALLRDPAPRVRAAALAALSLRGTAGDLPAIEALFTDPEDLVRAAAVTATAKLGRPHDAARLGLPDPSPRVRRAALRAALALAPDRRRDLLAAAPEEEDPYLLSLRNHVTGAD
jgi:HEAT repeat protein